MVQFILILVLIKVSADDIAFICEHSIGLVPCFGYAILREVLPYLPGIIIISLVFNCQQSWVWAVQDDVDVVNLFNHTTLSIIAIKLHLYILQRHPGNPERLSFLLVQGMKSSQWQCRHR
eukprot:GHVO01059802.1.p1 GENE.GHVO01059802.1~~GHVO01059802.1.p1  ORF type:complete len:120 (+),score=1.78 GHVO01059802.1:122-481(+)